MLKNLLFLILSFLICLTNINAQIINVSGITTTGRLNTCSPGLGQPVITVTYISGPGSTVVNGNLVCTNPCDSTVIQISVSNVRWNQVPGANWIHGFFFPPGGATGFTFISSTLAPTNWIPIATGGCTGTCPAGGNFVGGPGYYFKNSVQNAPCCPGGVTTPDPCDNWGDGTITCGVDFAVTFTMRLCNSIINGSPKILRLVATADGNTGCWSIPDATFNSLLFQFNTVACPAPVFTPNPVAAAPVQSCNPAPNFVGTYTVVVVTVILLLGGLPLQVVFRLVRVRRSFTILQGLLVLVHYMLNAAHLVQVHVLAEERFPAVPAQHL